MKELKAMVLGIETLAAQRDEARASLKRAEEEIADLKREIGITREELRQKTLDVEYLTISRKLSETPQALADARSAIRGMIAKVDKAISLLKGDAHI